MVLLKMRCMGTRLVCPRTEHTLRLLAWQLPLARGFARVTRSQEKEKTPKPERSFGSPRSVLRGTKPRCARSPLRKGAGRARIFTGCLAQKKRRPFVLSLTFLMAWFSPAEEAKGPI